MNRTNTCLFTAVLAAALPLAAQKHSTQSPASAAPSHASTPLTLIHTMPLPGISGDFDHFAIDLKGHRLFLVGEDQKTVEVLSLLSHRRIRTLTGFGTPHSILYLPATDELYVTDGGDGTIKILRGSDYAVTGKIKLIEGADSIGYDPEAQRLFVVTGGKDVPLDHSFLTAVDLPARKSTGDLRFENNHVEAMALEKTGSRLFINITDKNQVAVVDRKSLQVTARWTVGVAQENSPIAFDESTQRLFLVCRKPGALVVMNAQTGAVVTTLPAAGRADDVAYDHANHRIYVPGGEGFISVIGQDDADHYHLITKIPTAPGAKTALLVPELHTLFVAVSPGDTKALAKVLVFDVAP